MAIHNPKQITLAEYISERREIPLLDVRTPAEFNKGHIPNAVNLPIFSNEERVEIGTIYKNIGREEAILLGFDYSGPKWRGFIKKALEVSPEKKVCVHCWRGGMRSEAMAWALSFFGFEVHIIEGGYKSYRNWALQQFQKEYPLQVLGGLTGTHKTEILIEMRKEGVPIIDLEGLAQHKGSAFGSMNRLTQPSQEQFENNLAEILVALNSAEIIWVEDESAIIGNIRIPGSFWKQMQIAPVVQIRMDLEERVDFLVREYNGLGKEFLINSTERISKRLGLERTKNAIEAIKANEMDDFIRNVLVYYDKAYHKCLLRRNPEKIFPVNIHFDDVKACTRQILDFKNNLHEFS